MAISQDQAKIVIQILEQLRFLPADGVLITGIIAELDKFVIDKMIKIPEVLVVPENINITIKRK